jgi:hypothetical protein
MGATLNDPEKFVENYKGFSIIGEEKGYGYIVNIYMGSKLYYKYHSAHQKAFVIREAKQMINHEIKYMSAKQRRIHRFLK